MEINYTVDIIVHGLYLLLWPDDVLDPSDVVRHAGVDCRQPQAALPAEGGDAEHAERAARRARRASAHLQRPARVTLQHHKDDVIYGDKLNSLFPTSKPHKIFFLKIA